MQRVYIVHMTRDSVSGAKHCRALLDLLSEMAACEGDEQLLVAAKVVAALAIAALDGDKLCSAMRCARLTFCSAAGGTTCVSLAAKGAIAGVVAAADPKDCGSRRSGIMLLVASAFFSSMSECAKVRLPLTATAFA
jgi:hypothetical protein